MPLTIIEKDLLYSVCSLKFKFKRHFHWFTAALVNSMNSDHGDLKQFQLIKSALITVYCDLRSSFSILLFNKAILYENGKFFMKRICSGSLSYTQTSFTLIFKTNQTEVPSYQRQLFRSEQKLPSTARELQFDENWEHLLLAYSFQTIMPCRRVDRSWYFSEKC